MVMKIKKYPFERVAAINRYIYMNDLGLGWLHTKPIITIKEALHNVSVKRRMARLLFIYRYRFSLLEMLAQDPNGLTCIC